MTILVAVYDPTPAQRLRPQQMYFDTLTKAISFIEGYIALDTIAYDVHELLRPVSVTQGCLKLRYASVIFVVIELPFDLTDPEKIAQIEFQEEGESRRYNATIIQDTHNPRDVFTDMDEDGVAFNGK